MLSSETVSNAIEQLQSTSYSYDNRGSRTSAKDIVGDEYSENYTYDLNNRLTKVAKVVYNEYEHPGDKWGRTFFVIVLVTFLIHEKGKL